MQMCVRAWVYLYLFCNEMEKDGYTRIVMKFSSNLLYLILPMWTDLFSKSICIKYCPSHLTQDLPSFNAILINHTKEWMVVSSYCSMVLVKS